MIDEKFFRLTRRKFAGVLLYVKNFRQSQAEKEPSSAAWDAYQLTRIFFGRSKEKVEHKHKKFFTPNESDSGSANTLLSEEGINTRRDR